MNRRLVIPLLVLAVVGIGVAAVSRLGRPEVGSAVARVGATTITETELQVRVMSLLPMASFHGNIPAEQLTQLRRTALDELILDALVWEDARARGQAPDPGVVDAELEAVKQRFDSEAAFEAALREDGTSLDTFRDRLARTVLAREERRRLAMLPEVTEEEVRAYYAVNGAEFLRPEQVRLQQILVKVDPAAGEEEERTAEAQAEAILARLSRGASFDALAREVSQDPHREEKGDLGWVHRGRLEPDFEAEVFAAPVGELRQSRSLAGFHVFRVLERQPPQQLSLEEVHPLVVDRARRARRAAAREDWEERLREGVRIEILDATLRRATPLELMDMDSRPDPAETPMPPGHPRD